MIYRILINLSTIKKNPNAGRTFSVVMGPVEIDFDYQGEVPDYLKDGDNFYMTEINNTTEGINFSGALKDHGLEERLGRDPKATVTISRDSNRIDHAPEASHFYSYEKTQVECIECVESFDHEELETDETELGWYSDTICPKCGEWDCCQLDVERISEALERKKKAKNGN